MNGAISNMISFVYETHFNYQKRKIVKLSLFFFSALVSLKSRTSTLGHFS